MVGRTRLQILTLPGENSVLEAQHSVIIKLIILVLRYQLYFLWVLSSTYYYQSWQKEAGAMWIQFDELSLLLDLSSHKLQTSPE